MLTRQKLTLSSSPTGRRVPEALPLAARAMLIARPSRTRREAAAQFGDADLPLLMAGTGNIHNDRGLREVSFG